MTVFSLIKKSTEPFGCFLPIRRLTGSITLLGIDEFSTAVLFWDNVNKHIEKIERKDVKNPKD